MEYVAQDDDGRSFIGWSQDEDQSCGPACVYMVEAIGRQACLVGAEERIRKLLVAYFNDGPQDAKDRKANDFNLRGINSGKLRDALNAEGFTCTMSNALPSPLTSATFPLIAHIAWPDKAGHFIVIAGVTRAGNAVCLDPWFGLQQVSIASMPTYAASCSRYAKCTGGKGGNFSGWCITLQ